MPIQPVNLYDIANAYLDAVQPVVVRKYGQPCMMLLRSAFTEFLTEIYKNEVLSVMYTQQAAPQPIELLRESEKDEEAARQEQNDPLGQEDIPERPSSNVAEEVAILNAGLDAADADNGVAEEEVVIPKVTPRPVGQPSRNKSSFFDKLRASNSARK